MEMFQSIMTSPAVEHLVMTLLHSLWQGALIAGLLWLLLQAIKDRPNVRYTLSLLGLAVLVVALFATYSTLEQRADRAWFASPAPVPYTTDAATVSTTPPSAATSSAAEGRSGSTQQSQPQETHEASVQWQHVLFLLWCAGALLMSIRMVMWLGGVRHLRRRCAVGTEPALGERVNALKTLLAIGRPVMVGFSMKVLAPCTIGFLRPMIVLPLEMAQLGPDDIESILLHELAHIKRFDWLVNILQMVLESLLFFNPALWWISRQVRIEREAACDRYVVTRTRRPAHYAQLLLQFARAGHEAGRAVAFASSSDRSLTERVKRLIVPGYKAAVHPGIIPVLLTLAALAFCGMGAYKTTAATVRYFGKHMTPEQRAETVTALKEDYHTEGRPPELPKDQRIHVHGRIVTADGKPLPIRTSTYHGRTFTRVDAHLMTQTANASGSHAISNNGTFDVTFAHTRFTISVECQGYAVKHVQMECEPGESIDDLVIELEKGYTAHIVCTDPQGNPIPGAVLVGGYPLPPNYGSYSHTIDLTTDSNGVATFNNATEALMSLTCQAPGFVKAGKQKFQLAEGQRLSWVLQPAPTTHVHVTDARTGEPIGGAPVYVNGPRFNASFGHNQPGQTETDAAGRAVLDSLAPHELYLVMIHPEGMQRRYFKIRAGEDIDAAFEPAQPIRGRIFGDLSELPIDQDGLELRITDSYQADSTSRRTNTDRRRYPITIIDPCQATFEVDDYYGQQVTVAIEPSVAKVKVDVEAGDHLHETFIHLDPEETQEDVHMVRFHFTGRSADDIPPGTTVRVTYRQKGKTYGEAESVEIIDEWAKLAMPMTNSISWGPDVGTPIFFKKGHQQLDEERDYTIEVPCMPAGSVYGTIDVPKDYQYQYAYVRLEFQNRDEMFQQTGFLPNNDLNLTTGPETKFLFSPLPLGGEYIVIATCKNMMLVSDAVHLTPEQPFCEMTLPWPEKTVTLRGRIVDPNGDPVPNLPYFLSAQAPAHGHTFQEQQTDGEGRFACGPVNTDASISYRLRVKPNRWPAYEYSLRTTDASQTLKLKKAVSFAGVLKDHDGNLRPNTTFNVQPADRSSGGGYATRTIETDAQGRFQTILGDIKYMYYARRRLPDNNGRKSYTIDGVDFHPRKDNGITIVIDPH